MIYVEKPTLDASDPRIGKATLEIEALVAKFRDGKPLKDPSRKAIFRDELYKAYMDDLLTIFKHKCAYCETTLAGQPGDVEHFRPKGRVVDRSGKPARIMHHWTKEQVEHPGYFWLAYEWANLLPSCADCNRERKHGKGHDKGQGTNAGKADVFPVKGDRYVCLPEELDKEEPLLINPSLQNPDDHIEIVKDEKGRILLRAKTEKGEATLKLLGLNIRESVVKQRTKEYRNAVNALKAFVAAVAAGGDEGIREAAQNINQMWAGEQPYIMAQRHALLKTKAEWQQFGIPVQIPIPLLPVQVSVPVPANP